MAHIIYLRDCRSFVGGKDLIYGPNEEIERNLDQTKLKLTGVREGYCIPTSSRIALYHSRVKKECIPEMVSVMGGKNLNPSPNNVTLWSIYKGPRNTKSELQSVGRTFLIIRWIFKWINRKKTTSTIFFLLGIFTLSPMLFILGFLILFNPVKPVPEAQGNKTVKLTNAWNTHYFLGTLKDPKEVMSDGEVMDDVL